VSDRPIWCLLQARTPNCRAIFRSHLFPHLWYPRSFSYAEAFDNPLLFLCQPWSLGRVPPLPSVFGFFHRLMEPQCVVTCFSPPPPPPTFVSFFACPSGRTTTLVPLFSLCIPSASRLWFLPVPLASCCFFFRAFEQVLALRDRTLFLPCFPKNVYCRP